MKSGIPLEIEQSYLSTTHPLHEPTHEFNHLGQLKLLAVRFRKIPERFKSVYENLSLYASESILGEVETELLTKSQLGKLTKEEENCWKFLRKLFIAIFLGNYIQCYSRKSCLSGVLSFRTCFGI